MAIKNWFDFIPFESKIKKSAGVVIILKNNKILLCHATNSKWNESFGPPKGGLEIGEAEIDGAIRELKEETSIIIDKNKISNPKHPINIDYIYKTGVIYKRLYLYTVFIEDVSEIGLSSERVSFKKLQSEEIDWCGFLTKKEAKKKILPRFSIILNILKQ